MNFQNIDKEIFFANIERTNIDKSIPKSAGKNYRYSDKWLKRDDVDLTFNI